MKRRIENRLDRILDGANPIVVRDSLGSFMLALLMPLYMAVVIVLYFLDIPEFDLEYLAFFGGIGWILILIVAATSPPFGLWKARIEDELLDLTPMTPRTQANGYLTAPVVLAVASTAYFASFPFFGDGRIYGNELSNIFLAMLYSFLFFISLSTFFFAFHTRITKNGQQYVAFFCAMIGLLLMLLPSLGVLNHPSTPDFHLTRWAGFMHYFVFLPGIMFTITVTFYMLSLYHFSRLREPFWRSIAVNWFACLMLGGFYAIIVFVAHLFRILSPFGS